MTIEIVQGTNSKPAASQELVEVMSGQTALSGQLFIGYPIISTPKGPYSPDAILVSADKGIVLFDLIEGIDIDDYGLRQDDAANKLDARLKTHRELMQRRDLRIKIHTISFAPAVSNLISYVQDDYLLVNSYSLMDQLQKLTWENRDENIYKRTLAAIESITTIRTSRTKRMIKKENSKGDKLKRLEESIATLDHRQSKAFIETVEGVQRIRGLAGSGKTIVLALKAAYLYAKHPEWRIGVTFNTRSLKAYFRRLINNFVIEQTGEEPDWNHLRIVHAWGAPGDGDDDGIYYEFCHENDIEYFNFGEARKVFGQGKEFAEACKHALGQTYKSKQLYDALLIDEAQDFSPAFLKLCYALLRDPKRLVYAYDELQTLFGGSLSSPEDIFGNKADGSPRVRFDNTNKTRAQHDIILKKCYRNSRPVLVAAHALGFGIYREPPHSSETGLIQMFEQSQLWEEIGYRLQDGELKEGSPVILVRSEETSPKFLEDHSSIDDLIQFVSFDSEAEQTYWLTNSIKMNLEEDELRYNDIIVINPDPIKTREAVGPIRSRLLEMGVNSHLAGVDTGPDIFFDQDKNSVTFTGIYRAKGNEAGMVYIINAQDCHRTARDLASVRNRLFTAITRSKAWVRVLGIGGGMEELKKEYDKLKEKNFELQFIYPTRQQLEKLRIIHRDMTPEDRKRIQNREENLSRLVTELESGKVYIEDMDKETLDRLIEILRKNK